MSNIIKKTAEELLSAMNQDSEQKKNELVSTINNHSLNAVAAGLIPIPLADLAALTVNVWHMYVKINKILGISFKDNMMKSIASAVIANLSGNLLGVGAAGLLKLIPGAAITVGLLIAATDYAVCTSSAWVYLNALTILTKENNNIAEDSQIEGKLKRIIKDSKKQQNQIAKDAKAEYTKEHKDDK